MTQSIKRYVYKGKHKDINVNSTLLKVELCISIAIGIGYCGSIPHYALNFKIKLKCGQFKTCQY